MKDEPLSDESDSASQLPERKQINIRGRKEHESFLKDPKKCEEYGLDIVYETIVYLKRWGGWLKDDENKD